MIVYFLANAERDNDNLSSRLAKTSQLIYRLAGFLCLLENAAKIADTYLADFGSFGDGQPNQTMFDRILSIVDKEYASVLEIDMNQHLLVENSIANRAKNVALANFEQYKLLLFVEKDDGRNWNVITGKQVKFAAPNTATNLQPLHPNQRVCQRKSAISIIRIRNLLNKTKSLKVKLLEHDSIIFVKCGLYVDSTLKEAAPIVEETLLPELVNEGLILCIHKGIDGKWNKPSVFIKALPGGEMSREDLGRKLALYGDETLTIDTYLDKCKKVEIEGFGQVSDAVFEVFNRPEYQAMELDLTPLRNLKPSESYFLTSFPENSSIIGKVMLAKGSRRSKSNFVYDVVQSLILFIIRE